MSELLVLMRISAILLLIWQAAAVVFSREKAQRAAALVALQGSGGMAISQQLPATQQSCFNSCWEEDRRRVSSCEGESRKVVLLPSRTGLVQT